MFSVVYCPAQLREKWTIKTPEWHRPSDGPERLLIKWPLFVMLQQQEEGWRKSLPLEWKPVQSPVVDQGPLYLSCASLDAKTNQLVAVTSLEKNRFCELVRFDLGTGRWSACTRTRHFRPPKRVGAAAVSARGHLFVFGGYELSNQQQQQQQQAVSNNPPGLNNNNLLTLFGYPLWWLGGDIMVEPVRTACSIGKALGDFHAYDLTRADWTVLINRDQLPVVPNNNNRPWIAAADWRKRTTSNNSGSSSTATTTNNHWPLTCGNLPTDPLPSPRAFHTMTKHGGVLYVFGGENFGDTNMEYMNDLWACDIQQGLRWTKLWPQQQQQSLPTSSSQKKLSYRDQLLLQLEARNGEYYSTTGPHARSAHATVAFQKILYVIGGQNSTIGRFFDDIWAFDLKRGSWTNLLTTGTGPGPICGHTALVVGKHIVVYGGLRPDDVTPILKHRLNEGNSKRPHNFEFVDRNTAFALNLSTLEWTQFSVTGSPPVNARFFGRVYSFVKDDTLWVGGATGAEDFHGFEISSTKLPSTITATSSAAAAVVTASTTTSSGPLRQTTSANSVSSSSSFVVHSENEQTADAQSSWLANLASEVVFQGMGDGLDWQKDYNNMMIPPLEQNNCCYWDPWATSPPIGPSSATNITTTTPPPAAAATPPPPPPPLPTTTDATTLSLIAAKLQESNERQAAENALLKQAVLMLMQQNPGATDEVLLALLRSTGC